MDRRDFKKMATEIIAGLGGDSMTDLIFDYTDGHPYKIGRVAAEIMEQVGPGGQHYRDCRRLYSHYL